MKQRFDTLEENPSIYELAIEDCFKHKWSRNDVLDYIEKNAGIPRHELFFAEADNSLRPLKNEIIKDCAASLEEMIEDIKDGNEVDIMPPKVRARADGMTGKVREIALLEVEHQLLEHVTFLLLKPHLKASILPTQHASIPKRGQTALKKQIKKYLRRDLGIQYFQKTDMKGAYASVQYSVVIKLLKKDIPDATEIFTLLEYLGKLAPGGHLIIGGYLDAWLFNYVMSKVIKKAYECTDTRRGKSIRSVVAIVAFMDDCVVLSRSIKGIKTAVSTVSRFAKNELCMTLKITTGITKLLSTAEEKARRRDKSKARRGCPSIDMGGYKICRDHVAIRARVFIRTRRQFMRAWGEYKRTKTIQIQRARKLISYYGFVKQSDSAAFIKKYHVKKLIKIARKVSSFYTQVKRQERLGVIDGLRKSTEQYKAELSAGGGTSRWPADGRYYKEHLGSIARRRAESVPV